ncbi:MAG: trigger factor [Candidatus Nealsonbacteria bacterium]
MKTQIKKIPESKIELEIEIPADEFNKFFEQATKNIIKDIEVQGFRKGKAPKEIVEQKAGKGNILADAADLAVKEIYPKVLSENKIEPISQPEIEVLKLAENNPFIFRAKTSILPEIELGDYKKIAEQIERKQVSVTDEEIKNALIWLQKSRAKFVIKNTPAEKGDFVEIEYWSPQIKELSKEKPRKDSFIIGEAHFIPGFEEHLIGMKTEDKEKEFSLDFPADYPEKELAGTKADFNVKVILIQKVELPEINDEFVKTLGQFENLEGLKKNIKEGIMGEKEKAETHRVRDEILSKISEASNFETPKVLIEREQLGMMDNLKREVSEKLNIPLKDYLEKIKKTEEEIYKSFEQEAIKKIRNFLIAREIGEKENVQVSDDEVREEMNTILKQHPTTEKDSEKIDMERLKDYSREVLRSEKIFAILENLSKKSK